MSTEAAGFPVIERGPLWPRLVCSGCCLVLLVFFVVTLVTDLGREPVPSGWVVTDLVLGTASGMLAARCLAARSEFTAEMVTLHGVFRSRRLRRSDIDGITVMNVLGWPANALRLVGGRRVLLPLVTQPGTEQFLREVRERIADVGIAEADG